MLPLGEVGQHSCMYFFLQLLVQVQEIMLLVYMILKRFQKERKTLKIGL